MQKAGFFIAQLLSFQFNIMMKRKLLKIVAVWLLFVFMIDGCFSTLSKSDRGKKKKKEEVKFLYHFEKHAYAICSDFKGCKNDNF